MISSNETEPSGTRAARPRVSVVEVMARLRAAANLCSARRSRLAAHICAEPQATTAPPGYGRQSSLVATGKAGPLAAPWLPDARFEIPVALDVAAREFSASQLEALLSCRYRYFTHYVVGLSTLNLVRQPSLDVATKGDIAHHVLEALGAPHHRWRR